MNEGEPRQRSEATGKTLEVLGRFGVVGSYVIAYFAGAGELIDRLIATDNYPGGDIGKVALGLGATAAGFIIAGHYVKKH